jgi:hypothetical protein
MLELTQTQQLEATQEIIDYRPVPRLSTLRSFSKESQITTGSGSSLFQIKLKPKESLPSSSMEQTTLSQSSMSGMQIETQMLRDLMMGGESGDTEMLGTSYPLFSPAIFDILSANRYGDSAHGNSYKNTRSHRVLF